MYIYINNNFHKGKTMSILFIVPLIILAIVLLIVQRALEMKKLAESGVPIAGKVINKIKRGKKGSKNKFIKYEYITPRGQVFSRSSAVSDSVWEQYNEGDKIDLIYLENNPKICGPKYLVDLAKQANHSK